MHQAESLALRIVSFNNLEEVRFKDTSNLLRSAMRVHVPRVFHDHSLAYSNLFLPTLTAGSTCDCRWLPNAVSLVTPTVIFLGTPTDARVTASVVSVILAFALGPESLHCYFLDV